MAINNNILSVIEKTPDAIIKDIAGRVKERRLESALTQQELAKRAGIPLPTYRRFERTGEISFRSLVMLGITLGMMEEFLNLFSTKTYSSIDNLLEAGNKKRQRGKRNG
ncbi:MAG: helix-turn-helix transcriptional regulator [Dysgonamonadaceae bacterium]|jgi:transcriptional regulator with XRE-family HTH domain|nr:helix-turn-helix transcriptional regulator [Dysgonamonadaceae bacterium]